MPSIRSVSENNTEEERRLCYVGITRAKENLYLTCAKQRTIFGSTTYNSVSRFVEEIPMHLLKDIEDSFITKKKEDVFSSTNSTSKAFATNSAKAFIPVSMLINKISENKDVDVSIFREGQKIYHKKFGEGVITKTEAEGNDVKLDIQFEKSGKKRLMAKFANLEVM